MRRLLFAALLASAVLGSNHVAANPNSKSGALDASITLPTTVEGFLVIEAADGDVDAAGTFENNYGTFTVGTLEIAVEISGSVLKPIALPPAGGRVLATLGSRSDEFGFPLYIVTVLRRL